MTTTPAESPDGIVTRWFSLRVAWLAWIVLACALSVKAVGWPDDHSVYPCFETGARLWWTGQDVYDPKVCPCDFRYGPACAVAFVPMALLPSQLGGLLWIWLNLAVFFFTLWRCCRLLPGPWTPRREGVFLCLVLLGTVRSFWSGQTNLLIFALVALGAMAIADRRGGGLPCCWRRRFTSKSGRWPPLGCSWPAGRGRWRCGWASACWDWERFHF